MNEEWKRFIDLVASDIRSDELDGQDFDLLMRLAPGVVFRVFELSELNKESERGCVLVGAALLDEMLGNLLRAKFTEDNHLDSKDIHFLLTKRPVPPLGSFAMRIIFSHAFGLIDGQTRRALDAIRDLRNQCSHFSKEVMIDLNALAPALAIVPKYSVMFGRFTEQEDKALERKARYACCVMSLLFEIGLRNDKLLSGQQSGAGS